MSDLTREQLAFLAAHGIPLSAMFDASGMRKPDYQQTMRESEKSFAHGVTACSRGGHRLRTRAGHCIQCDHSKIAYMLRHEAPATVYIAASIRGQLMKVGSSGLVPERRMMLNAYRYGDQSDWQMLATACTPAAGRVECDVHAKLARYSVPGGYWQGGKRRSCYELFKCNLADALEALRTSLPDSIELTIADEGRSSTKFNFR